MFWTDIAPWLAALIIGAGSAFVNWRISKRQFRSSESIAQKQIQKDLEIAREVIRKESSIAEKNIKATLIAASRRKWIDDVRTASSKIIALIVEFRLAWEVMLPVDELDSQVRIEQTKGIVSIAREFVFEASQVDLLLNQNEEKHQTATDYLYELRVLLMEDEESEEADQESHSRIFELADDYADLIKEIIKEEWERVKKVE